MRDRITKWPLNSPWRECVFALLLASATIFVYRPAWHGGFLWDDDAYVTNNELLTAPDGLRRIWFSLESPSQYFPLVYTSFRVERALWGLDPTGYHITNIILHIINALLVWRILLRLRVPGAWLAAAIFALHPVQVESVAWITERKNVLMGLFFLSALLAWIAFIDPRTKRRWTFYALALVLYALALFSKTTACTLPAALLLVLWLEKKPIDQRRLAQIAPFLVLGVAMGLLTVWWERYHQGTHGPVFALGAAERILVASRAAWFYIGKLVWPANLTFIYPRWIISVTQPFAYLWLLAGIGLGAAILLARKYVGRSVEVSVLFFLTTLSPVIGFIMLYTFRFTFVADHYQYLASIGPIALASAGIALLARFKRVRSLLLGFVACLLGGLALLSFRQSTMYADIEVLWRTTIARNPSCWMAHNNLGIVLSQKEDIDEAIEQYRITLAMSPDFSDADYNLGNALLQKGEIGEAIAHCRRAVAGQPNDSEAQVALGNALLRNLQIDEAIQHYERALVTRPYYFVAHYNLGHALLEKGATDSAIFHCRAALSIQPENVDSRINLAMALLQKGQIRDSIAQYERALQIDPRSIFAQNNLAWLLATCPTAAVRNGERALELARQANELSGGTNSTILRSLAAAYAETGQFAEAVATAQKGIRIAEEQRDDALRAAIREEITFYQSKLPYRDSAK